MKITRRRLAQYIASGLPNNRAKRLNEAAAWLISNHRKHEAALLSRDIASILGDKGYVTSTVITARPLNMETKKYIENYIIAKTSARELEISTKLEPSFVGGLKIILPDGELDATVSSKLRTLVMEMN